MIKRVYYKLIELISSFCDWIRFRSFFRQQPNKKFIVLVSHSGDTGGGAPVVLYELAKELNTDSNVIFLTHTRGRVIKSCKKNNINVFVTSFLYKKYLKLINQYTDKIDFVVINTAVLYPYLSYLEKLEFPGKVVWWIHEGGYFIKKHKNNIKQYKLRHLRICCVSLIVKTSIENNCHISESNLPILPYGIVDKGVLPVQRRTEPFIITLIGRIEERKNQLELVQAYKKLPKVLQSKTKVIMVTGSYDEDYLAKLNAAIGGQANISIIGPIARDKMRAIYSKSNLVVCTSKSDPLPVVITEAMMYGRLFVSSDGTGQALIMKDTFEEFIYKRGNIDGLAKIISRVYTHYDDYRPFYEKERDLYLKNFTISESINKLKEIVKKMD